VLRSAIPIPESPSAAARATAFREFVRKFYDAKWSPAWDDVFATYYRISPARPSCAAGWKGAVLPVPWSSDAELRAAMTDAPATAPPFGPLRQKIAAVENSVRRNRADFSSFALSAEYLDYLYWRQPEAKLASAVDFITMHTYPMWGHEDIDTAMASTIRNYESVRAAHPGKTIVLGEAGWASYTVGDQHAPRAGDEKKQKRYYEELTAWAKASGVTLFYFEAFDELWKGTGTEGHWGLFSEGRKAKLAMQALYPELMPSALTSPGYDPPAVPAVKEKQ